MSNGTSFFLSVGDRAAVSLFSKFAQVFRDVDHVCARSTTRLKMKMLPH